MSNEQTARHFGPFYHNAWSALYVRRGDVRGLREKKAKAWLALPANISRGMGRVRRFAGMSGIRAIVHHDETRNMQTEARYTQCISLSLPQNRHSIIISKQTRRIDALSTSKSCLKLVRQAWSGLDSQSSELVPSGRWPSPAFGKLELHCDILLCRDRNGILARLGIFHPYVNGAWHVGGEE